MKLSSLTIGRKDIWEKISKACMCETVGKRSTINKKLKRLAAINGNQKEVEKLRVDLREKCVDSE